jgi:hypothetical protein
MRHLFVSMKLNGNQYIQWIIIRIKEVNGPIILKEMKRLSLEKKAKDF